MNTATLVRALQGLKMQTGSLACLGCGHEHNCGIHGCAIIREAAELISSIQCAWSSFPDNIDHLLKLYRAAKEGRVVVLPVRPVLTQSIGSMLYIIEDGEIIEDALCEALIGMASNGEINIFYTTLSDQISFEQADIGKTVFLTYEDAEKALASGRAEND